MNRDAKCAKQVGEREGFAPVDLTKGDCFVRHRRISLFYAIAANPRDAGQTGKRPAGRRHYSRAGTFIETSAGKRMNYESMSVSSARCRGTSIWYLPSSQRPRSTSLQRSEQNGKVAGPLSDGSATSFLQMGHEVDIAELYAHNLELARRRWQEPRRRDYACCGVRGR